ncbi:DUF305 domain-containing protein [Lentzea cavernae]|uniref:DUF305 domain-containing protein n=1 Tax=Lentzea cavernae TaxID=2020703 RepID=A0ABQ3M7Y3_9PSEU|nr:DUF305 domain-containing protein [Lentzea cavernae]GHH33978.1 hypothetical protein GCM10017774_17290 [Lentzea cavernae]
MKKSLIGAVVGMLVLSACGSPANNAADVTFAQEMVPHHQQALDMAKLVPSRSSDSEVRDLAQRIEKAQGPEIAQMNEWLQQWGAAQEDHEGHDTAGMMSHGDMAELEKSTGQEFDRLWLRMMIEHHEGAVEMARTALQRGEDEKTRKLAQAVLEGQQREIAEMKALLG